MTKYKIKLYSKNKQSLKQFVKFFEKTSHKLRNLYSVLNISKIKKRRKIITVLKSPHVNKKAQEQFQSVTYCNVVKLSSWEIKKNTVLLKKIKNRLFPDIKLRIEKIFNSKETKLLKNNLFYPKKISYRLGDVNCSLKNLKEKKLLTVNPQVGRQKLLEKTVLYLKLLDNYGHLEQK